jgi:hypothetical protein
MIVDGVSNSLHVDRDGRRTGRADLRNAHEITSLEAREQVRWR